MEGKYPVSSRQVLALIAMFILGTSLLFSLGQELGRHSWLGIITGFIAFLFLFWLYYFLLKLEPGKSLFGLNEQAFGRGLGTVINLWYLIYFFVLLSVVVGNFVDFINSVILIQTPEILLTIFLTLTAAYAVKKGLESIARLSEIMVFCVFTTAIVVTLLLFDKIDTTNFWPLWPQNWALVLRSGFSILTFPFGETVIFLSIFYQLGGPQKVSKGFFWGSVVGVFVLLVIALRNIAVLGEFVKFSTYPAYDSVRLINIARFITRAEVVISLNYMFAGYVKATTVYYSLCLGLKEIFRLKTYQHLVLPIAALVILNAHLSFSTNVQNVFFAFEVYPFFAIIFQLILILATLIMLLIKKQLGRRRPTI